MVDKEQANVHNEYRNTIVIHMLFVVPIVVPIDLLS